MEGPRFTLLLIILLFIFFSPDQNSIRFNTTEERERLTEEKHQDFDALANSKYGDLPKKGLNLTGLRLDDGYQLTAVLASQDLARRQQVDAWYGFDRTTPVYHDIDGDVRGDFKQYVVIHDSTTKINLTQLDPGTQYMTTRFERNVTDETGQLTINLEGVGKPARYMAREVKATVQLFSESSPGNGWDARLRGIHFPSGSVVLTTTSRKWNALAALPHFMFKEDEFVRATSIMNASLTRIWETIENGASGDSAIEAAPKCELVIWMQQKPLPGSTQWIKEIEDELHNSDGAPMDRAPPMAFTATVFSPDCGYIIQSENLVGLKEQSYAALVRRLITAFCFALVAQILLLKRQMEKCATPSTRSRVAYQTFMISAFQDGLTFFALLGLIAVDLSQFLLAGAAAFLCCIHVAFLEVKFIFDIWTVQVGDPAFAERERQRRAAETSNSQPAATDPTATATPNTDIAPATTTPAAPPPDAQSLPLSGAGLPLPATARQPAASPPTITVTSDTTTATAAAIAAQPRPTFLSLYSKFYFALINLMFFTLWSTTWSPTIRHIYINLLVFAFFSLWIPQIYRNTMRNCRKALTWEYILGSSTLRAIPVLYWYISPRNILYFKGNSTVAFLLTSWLAFQILVLAAQQFLGPRTFIPEKWCPPAYDYHSILHDDLEAGGLPIGEVTSASEGKDADRKDGARKIFDCAICMNEIDVPVVSKDEKQAASGRSWLEQRKYMVTPCRHIFHTECLDGWMNMRLVCPVCREGLPPI